MIKSSQKCGKFIVNSCSNLTTLVCSLAKNIHFGKCIDSIHMLGIKGNLNELSLRFLINVTDTNPKFDRNDTDNNPSKQTHKTYSFSFWIHNHWSKCSQAHSHTIVHTMKIHRKCSLWNAIIVRDMKTLFYKICPCVMQFL